MKFANIMKFLWLQVAGVILGDSSYVSGILFQVFMQHFVEILVVLKMFLTGSLSSQTLAGGCFWLFIIEIFLYA